MSTAQPNLEEKRRGSESSCMLGSHRTEGGSRLRAGGSLREGDIRAKSKWTSRGHMDQHLLAVAGKDRHLLSREFSSSVVWPLRLSVASSSMHLCGDKHSRLCCLGASILTSFLQSLPFLVTDPLFIFEPTVKPSQVSQVTIHLSFWLTGRVGAWASGFILSMFISFR